jgi:glucose/arabinose dehydrogenase
MRARYRWIALAALLALAASSVWVLRAQVPGDGKRVALPVVRRSGLPLPPADEASARLKVPAGFAVRIYASGLDGPRLMTVGPDGQLYVAERGADAIVRLPDADSDGLADASQAVATGLDGPHSAEWHGGSLYVAENSRISKLTDANADGDFLDPGERVTITDDIPCCGGHSTRTLHFGPDGKLYVAAGSSCNVCAEQDKRRATIMRFNADGSIPADNPFVDDPDPQRRPVWAEGLRNSVDFLFMPDGQLWADHNGRDNMIDQQVKNQKPLEEIVIPVQRGRQHGWPFCTSEHANGSPDPGPGPYVEVADPSADVPDPPAGFSCANAVPALFTATAHSAPLGMARYAGANFPADYLGDLFIALHGSWNRTPPAPCRVVRVQVSDGQPTAAEDFLAGFQSSTSQSCGSAWGRPAGVAAGIQGELFVSDDQNGNIYRVIYVGGS